MGESEVVRVEVSVSREGRRKGRVSRYGKCGDCLSLRANSSKTNRFQRTYREALVEGERWLNKQQYSQFDKIFEKLRSSHGDEGGS